MLKWWYRSALCSKDVQLKYVNIYKHYIIEKYEDLKIVIENFVIKYKIKLHGHVLLLLDILLVVNI